MNAPPHNILVALHDGAAVPKVIDFGIAKATEGRLGDHTLYTHLHQFLGTPAYMSPEQAEMSGLDIDTRSDIYSLGVVLYELLAGSTPFDATELMASGIDGMRRTIREQEPPAPSTRLATLQADQLTTTAQRRSADASKLASQLKGDLDWIVIKCLEKDRTRRYETANGLVADIRRHLQNEPVLARPQSAAYRFQKAYRRHRVLFTTVACVFGAMIFAMTLIWRSAEQERRARAAADAQTLLADGRLIAALGLVDSLVETNVPHLSTLSGGTEATERLLLSIVAMVEALNREQISQPLVRLRLADLNRSLSTVRGVVPGSSSLGDPETALKFASEALRLVEDPGVQELPREAWLPVLLRARMGMGFNLHALLRFEEALDSFRAALSDATALAGNAKFTATAIAQAQIERSRCQISIGRILRDLGRDREALEDSFLPVLAWSRTLDRTNDFHTYELPSVYLNIGDTLAWLGRTREALTHADEGLRISEALAMHAPNHARSQVLMSLMKSQKGKVLLTLGDEQGAKPLLMASLAEARRLVARDPMDAGMQLILCYVLGSHALGYSAWSRDATAPIEERRQRFQAALDYWNRADEVVAQLPSTSARLLPRHGLASTKRKIADAEAEIEASAQ